MAGHKKLCALARDFSLVCASGEPIKESRLSHEYQKCLHRSLSWRKYGCKNSGDLLQKLPIFVLCAAHTDLISLDKSRLLEFLLQPVVDFHRGRFLPFSELLQRFEKVTGLDAEFLWNVLGIESEASDVSVLADKLTSITALFEVQSVNTQPCLVVRGTSLPSESDPKGSGVSHEPLDQVKAKAEIPSKREKKRINVETSSVPFSNVPMLVPAPNPLLMHGVPGLPETDAKHPNPGLPETDARHPNPSVEMAVETILPSHALFRPELQLVRPIVQIVPRNPFPRNASKASMVDYVTSQFEDFLKDISSKNKFVPFPVVHMFLVDVVSQHRLPIRAHEIPMFQKQSMLYGRLEELIKVFCWFNPITSLHELELAIMSAENVDNFESLCIGPIHKHPRVCDLFKPPEGIESIPRITSYDIHNYLMHFLNKSQRGSKHSVEEFLEFMRSKTFVESAHHLCVRITSFALAIKTNFTFRRVQRVARERRERSLEQEIIDLLQHEISKLKRKLATSDNDPLSIRKEIANKDPVEILESIFKACAGYFSGHIRGRVLDFLQLVTANPHLRNIFIMSILEGVYGAEKLFHELSLQGNLNPQPSAMQSTDAFLQSPGKVLKELLHHLQRVPYPVDLGSLSRVEDQIVENFNAPTFSSLGNGSFLGYLASRTEAIETLGGNLIGCQDSPQHVQSIKSKVMTVISQLKPDQREKEVVAEAVATVFGVASYDDIGCGRLEKILMDMNFFNPTSEIAYLAPIILNGSVGSSQQLSKSTVGVLGHQTTDDALSRLCNAPLLEDLEQWSLWEIVYKPQLGALTDFLNKTAKAACKKHGLQVLQVAPHKLLRISPDSSVQDFSDAVKTNELNPVAASGHLVSLIVKRGSVHEIPLKLFAEQIKAGLQAMMTSGEVKRNLDIISSFVYHCIIRIPLGICCLIAKELFIDPLRAVCSSSVVDGLLCYCENIEQSRIMQALGMRIGVKSWSDDFSNKQSLEIPLKVQPVPQEVLPQDSPEVETAAAGVAEVHTQMSVSTLQQAAHQSQSELVEDKTFDRKTIIEKIRVDEFGVGIEFDEVQSKVALKQRLREGRSLKRLSLELYSKDTHFVLELIQNADDNSYPPSLLMKGSTEVPSLKFILSSKNITVLNNENGFSEQNIRALCDVGKSTKGTCRTGYIGQKGIGFKSVFRITNTPMIHSNGFHIKFDASTDPIGYILPHWTEPIEETCAEYSTQIILPLKEDLQAATLAKKFYDVQPSLLLFLHRLRSITIEDQTSNKIRYMTRTDKLHGVIEIQHNDATDHWLVIRRKLNTAKKLKPDVEVTELALAFPLPPDVTLIPLARDLLHQQVFAFLPLRSYGFRFVVQADFDLPSSREDVNADSAWNQWLREEIPSLFVDALNLIKDQPGVSDLQAVAVFLQFVPLEGELHDFFLPVSRQIISKLKGAECLPTDPVHKKDMDLLTLLEPAAQPVVSDPLECVEWKQPSQLLLVSEKYSFIRQHIPQSLLSAVLNLQYLNSKLLPSVNSSLQQQLGVGSITNDHLREVALAMLDLYRKQCIGAGSEDYFDCDEDNILSECSLSAKLYSVLTNWIAKWLACIHIIIEDTNDISCISKLKSIPVIPLENGEFTSADQCSLFFPPDGDRKSSGAFSELFKEVNVVASSLFQQDDDLTQSRVRRVLEMFGVKILYPSNIIRHHILPIFTNGTWQKRKPKLLSMYLIYIKESIDQKSVDVTEHDMVRLLKDCVVVVTNHGPKLPSKDVVHFSKHYKCDPDLQTQFPEVKWTVVTESYLERAQTVESVIQWKHFLSKLGVKSGIVVNRVADAVVPEDSELLKLQGFRRLPPGPYTLRDWESEEFTKIVDSVMQIKSVSSKQAKMKKLAEMLDRHWSDDYHKYVQAHICCSSGDSIPVPSSFKTTLVNLSWLPPHSVTLPSPLYRGCDLYDQSKRICSLLHSHVPYVGVQLKNTDFIHLLGIRQEVNASEVLNYLRKWCDVCQKTDKPFVTSVQHMAGVYIYLKGESDKESLSGETSISDALQTDDLIFVPDNYEADTGGQDIPGHFVSVHKLCWMDPTTVLYYKQKYNKIMPTILPKTLQLYYGEIYPQMQQVFAHFRVPETPNVASLIALLKYISSESAKPEPNEVKNFTSVALCMGERYSDDVNKANFIHANLQQACIFPSHHHKWISLESALLENDDQSIAKLFINNDGLHFLQWPQELSAKSKSSMHRKMQENREAFLQLCGINNLSASVYPRIDKEFGDTRPVDELQEKLHDYIQLVQCFLHRHCKTQYDKLVSRRLQNKLARLQVFSKLKLECRYVIDHGYNEIVSTVAVQVLSEYVDNEEPPVVYVSAAKIKLSALLPALKKLFMSDGDDNEKLEFNNFLEDLVIREPCSEEEIKECFIKHDLTALPDEDEVWVVPLPVSKKRPPSVPEVLEGSESELYSEDESDSTDEDAQSTTSQLKSWPPRAPLNFSDEPRPKGKHSLPSSRQEITTSSNEVTAEDIEESRKKHLGITHDAKPVSDVVLPTDEETKNNRRTDSQSEVKSKHNVLGEKTDLTKPAEKAISASKPITTKGKHAKPFTPLGQEHSQLLLKDIQSFAESTKLSLSLISDDLLESQSTTGRWGEEFVYEVLKSKGCLPDGRKILNISWVNQSEESGSPFDITVDTGSEQVFIEVKSTSAEAEELVAMSLNEIKFADKERKNFFLYRVYNAGRSSCRLALLGDVYEHFEKKGVRFFFRL